MARRNKKRYRKYLGSRSWGAGNTKNRRGKGNRGGKGRAGMHKHMWLWHLKNEPARLRVGFASYKKCLETISLAELNARIEKGVWKADENGIYQIDLVGKRTKVLGSGLVKHKLDVKAACFSKKAKEKIENAGGKVAGEI